MFKINMLPKCCNFIQIYFHLYFSALLFTYNVIKNAKCNIASHSVCICIYFFSFQYFCYIVWLFFHVSNKNFNFLLLYNSISLTPWVSKKQSNLREKSIVIFRFCIFDISNAIQEKLILIKPLWEANKNYYYILIVFYFFR